MGRCVLLRGDSPHAAWITPGHGCCSPLGKPPSELMRSMAIEAVSATVVAASGAGVGRGRQRPARLRGGKGVRATQPRLGTPSSSAALRSSLSRMACQVSADEEVDPLSSRDATSWLGTPRSGDVDPKPSDLDGRLPP